MREGFGKSLLRFRGRAARTAADGCICVMQQRMGVSADYIFPRIIRRPSLGSNETGFVREKAR